jgi:hypothetical protein
MKNGGVGLTAFLERFPDDGRKILFALCDCTLQAPLRTIVKTCNCRGFGGRSTGCCVEMAAVVDACWGWACKVIGLEEQKRVMGWGGLIGNGEVTCKRS